MSDVHPEAESFLETIEDRGVIPFHTLSVEGARSMIRTAYEAGDLPIPSPVVWDRSIPSDGGSMTLRVYNPSVGESSPVIIYYHGGGWVLGDLETADPLCRCLADRSGYTVVSVDYRLAPEHPFPAAVLDGFRALEWVAKHGPTLGIDPGRIVVAGDSAGGNLAAAVALMARDRAGPDVVGQLLVYPQLEYAFDTDSYRENAEGYYLTRADMKWFWDHYLGRPIDERHPYASPLLAHDLRDLPPTHIVTAELDPLRDDGRQYAERLDAAGIPVTTREYEGMIHGFFTKVTRMECAHQAVDDVIEELRPLVSG